MTPPDPSKRAQEMELALRRGAADGKSAREPGSRARALETAQGQVQGDDPARRSVRTPGAGTGGSVLVRFPPLGPVSATPPLDFRTFPDNHDYGSDPSWRFFPGSLADNPAGPGQGLSTWKPALYRLFFDSSRFSYLFEKMNKMSPSFRVFACYHRKR